MYFDNVIRALPSKTNATKPDFSLKAIVENAEYSKDNGYYEQFFNETQTKITNWANPKNNDIPSEKTIKAIIDHINEVRLKEDPNQEPIKFYMLSDKEKTEREEIRRNAVPAFSKFAAKYHTAEVMATDFMNANKIPAAARPFYCMLSVGSNTPNDIMRDLNILFVEDSTQRQMVIERKINKALELLDKINKPMSDGELLETFKDNLSELFFFGELDGSKIQEIYKCVGLEAPEFILKKIEEVQPIVSSVALLTNKICNMANPCYPLIDEKNGPTLLNVFPEYDTYITQKTGKNYMEFFKDPKKNENGEVILPNAISSMSSMQPEIAFDDSRKTFELDLIYTSFIANDNQLVIDMDGITYTKEDFKKARIASDWNATKEQKEANKKEYDKVMGLLGKYDKGDRIAITDLNGKFQYSLHVDSARSTFPTGNDLFELDMDHPYNSIQSIYNELKEVDPWYISSHKEFKDLRTAIESLNDPKISNVKLYESLATIKDLALQYIDSKSQPDVDISSRTVARENFCKKLINSIDEFNLEITVATTANKILDAKEPIEINLEDFENNALDQSFSEEKSLSLGDVPSMDK